MPLIPRLTQQIGGGGGSVNPMNSASICYEGQSATATIAFTTPTQMNELGIMTVVQLWDAVTDTGYARVEYSIDGSTFIQFHQENFSTNNQAQIKVETVLNNDNESNFPNVPVMAVRLFVYSNRGARSRITAAIFAV